jgi:hypothetical protein
MHGLPPHRSSHDSSFTKWKDPSYQSEISYYTDNYCYELHRTITFCNVEQTLEYNTENIESFC